MDNKKKNIKQKRVQTYFIDAAKEIINTEGPHNVTVRKIADLSGYSYGSIYNYYADLDELMFETKNAMIYDMMNAMQSAPIKMSDGLDSVKSINRAFAEYFMNNTNIYEFFYNYQIKKTGKTPMDDIGFNEAQLQTYQPFVDAGIIGQEDLSTVFNTILYSLYGLLTLYFSSYVLSKEKVLSDLDDIIDYILRKS